MEICSIFSGLFQSESGLEKDVGSEKTVMGLQIFHDLL